MTEYKVELILLGTAAIIVSVALIMIIPASGDHTKRPNITITDGRTDTKGSANIYVDISGAVKKPGLYSAPSQSHISDIIRLSGGLTSDADTSYIAKYVNLAKTVENEEKIYIPFVNDGTGPDTDAHTVNINTASAQDIESLPRIGALTAQKIIEHRPYQSIDQLLQQKILSENLFNTVKDLISIY